MTHSVTKGNMVQRRGFDCVGLRLIWSQKVIWYNVGVVTLGFMTHSVTKGIMVQRGGFDFGLYDSFGHPFVEGKNSY